MIISGIAGVVGLPFWLWQVVCLLPIVDIACSRRDDGLSVNYALYNLPNYFPSFRTLQLPVINFVEVQWPSMWGITNRPDIDKAHAVGSRTIITACANFGP